MKKILPITLFAALFVFACSALRAGEQVNLEDAVEAYPSFEGVEMLCVFCALCG